MDKRNIDLKEHMGMIITLEGEVIPFGVWTDNVRSRDRENSHRYSFEDDIVSRDDFLSFHINYNPSVPLDVQTKNFTDAGVVLIRNTSISFENETFMANPPEHLSIRQKLCFQKLYPMLNQFQEQLFYDGYSLKYPDLNTFCEENQIKIDTNSKTK